MRNLLLICVFILIGFQVSAQKQGQELIDSLQKALSKNSSDTIKGRIYKRIVDEYFFIDTEQALRYSRIGLKHMTGMRWGRGIAVFNSCIGRAYSDKGNYDSSMFYYRKALSLHQSADDKRNMSSLLNNMGAAEQNLASNFSKAIKYYFEALKMAEILNDPYMIAICYDNISRIYFVQQNYQKALDYAFKGLNLRNKQKDTENTSFVREQAISLSNIAGIYSEMKNRAQAMTYYRKAIPLHEKTGNKLGLAMAYSNLFILPEKGQGQRLDYGLTAEQLWNEVNPMHLEAVNNLGNLGVAYMDMLKKDTLHSQGRPALVRKARAYLQKAIRLSIQNGETYSRSYFIGNLSELQAMSGDYKNAYLNFRAYQSTQDSVFSQASKNKIAELEGQREIALRDKAIKVNRLELAAQKKQRIGLLVGLGLLVVIGGLLYRQGLTRKRTNIQLLHLNSGLDEVNKIKTKFFAILSHDLRSPVANLISFMNLQKEAPEMISPEMTLVHQQRVADAAEVLLENMESMLLWSKGQMQGFKPHVRDIEVNTLFEYIEKFFAGTAHVHFSFHNPSALAVRTDEDFVKTIMQNLTNNAIKALAGTPGAVIRWEARQENEEIVLAVTDNGPGATADQLDALFTDQVSVGVRTGLGLHLVRDLAKAIACKISAKPNAGGGMEFQLAFP